MLVQRRRQSWSLFSLVAWVQFLFLSLRMSDGESARTKLVSVDFEIFGHVQGVCFRMYTEKEGLRLGLVGWVKNTYSGTVVGQVQGPAAMVEEMKVWLSKEGSPTSRITRASFSNQRTIDKLELSGFKTRF
ncbi:acylphosphatase-2 isoform X1 [Larimichthys crocea]|uniref:acylphosphatase-2 isoform X1 n=2 Tax=Larimichthys crocea TaxID=215358 RepID=UPI00090085B6|nr:acylphosphatase-2 isoform X1 [Larimichthys crocea]